MSEPRIVCVDCKKTLWEHGTKINEPIQFGSPAMGVSGVGFDMRCRCSPCFERLTGQPFSDAYLAKQQAAHE